MKPKSTNESGSNKTYKRPRGPKRRGEIVELAFLYKAVALGFGVAQPYGDSESYDFILDPRERDARNLNPRTQKSRNQTRRNRNSQNLDSRSKSVRDKNSAAQSTPIQTARKLFRVQVKSTARLRKGGYLIGACHHAIHNTKQSYTPQQIDFLVVYIIPEDAWYVIPIQAFYPQKWLSFYPQNPNSKARFESYREAWQEISNTPESFR